MIPTLPKIRAQKEMGKAETCHTCEGAERKVGQGVVEAHGMGPK